jgi:hypothetical protein
MVRVRGVLHRQPRLASPTATGSVPQRAATAEPCRVQITAVLAVLLRSVASRRGPSLVTCKEGRALLAQGPAFVLVSGLTMRAAMRDDALMLAVLTMATALGVAIGIMLVPAH